MESAPGGGEKNSIAAVHGTLYFPRNEDKRGKERARKPFEDIRRHILEKNKIVTQIICYLDEALIFEIYTK